jgi:hypothetical protein
MDIRETGCVSLNKIHLASMWISNRHLWMHQLPFRFHKMWEFLNSQRFISFSGSNLLQELGTVNKQMLRVKSADKEVPLIRVQYLFAWSVYWVLFYGSPYFQNCGCYENHYKNIKPDDKIIKITNNNVDNVLMVWYHIFCPQMTSDTPTCNWNMRL